MASNVEPFIHTLAILLLLLIAACNIVFSEGRVLEAIGNQAMVVDSHQNDEGGYDLPPPPHDHFVTGKKDKDKDKDTSPTMTVDRRLLIDDTDGGGGYEEDFRPTVPSSSPGVRHSTTPIDYAGEEHHYEGRVLKAIGKEEIDGHENQAMVVDSHQNTEEGDDRGYDLPPSPHDHSVTGKKDKDKDSPPTMTVDHRRLAIDDTVTEGGGGGYEEDFRPTAPSSSPGVRHSNTTIDYAGKEQP